MLRNSVLQPVIKISHPELLTKSIVFKLEAWRKLPAEYQVSFQSSLQLSNASFTPCHPSSISHLFEREERTTDSLEHNSGQINVVK
jgi:hypothetical protein